MMRTSPDGGLEPSDPPRNVSVSGHLFPYLSGRAHEEI